MSRVQQYEERLGPICVGLRKDLVFTRQEIRGEPSYVVHDPLSFQNHVFDVVEYRVLTAIIHDRTLTEAFDRLVRGGILQPGDKQEYYEFILGVHGMQLLQLPISDPEKLFERYTRKQQRKKTGWLRMLVHFKIPLWDPDRFLGRTLNYIGWLFSRGGVALWCGLLMLTVYSCWGHFGEMFQEAGNLLEPGNLPVLWLALVVLKAMHEFGHAYACKRLGGEVPEMGLVFILSTPCAYVDAGASWKFSSKWHRIFVGLAGMYIESFVAALFAIVWVSTPPGLLHDVALNVLVLASLATVLFNINPLMRFDGYFIMADLVGVPNLRERSTGELKRRAKKTFLRIGEPPSTDQILHRHLYTTYGVGAVVYKVFLAVSIAALLIAKWPVVGVMVGLAFAWTGLATPVTKLLDYLWRDEETEPVRYRARLLALGLILAGPGLLPFVPVSFQVVLPGVLEPDSFQLVRAPVDGFVTDVLVEDGDIVRKGDQLLVMDHPDLRVQHMLAVQEQKAEEARLLTVELTDQAQASVHRARLGYLRSQAVAMAENLTAMDVRAGTFGVVASPRTTRLRGRYVNRGDPLLEIHSGRYLVHVVLAEDVLERAELKVGGDADLRWSSSPDRSVTARIIRILPLASRSEIPVALTMEAGEGVYASQDEQGRVRADRPYVHVFLEPLEPPPMGRSGMTARVRLAGRLETLGAWVRRKAINFYQNWKMG